MAALHHTHGKSDQGPPRGVCRPDVLLSGLLSLFAGVLLLGGADAESISVLQVRSRCLEFPVHFETSPGSNAERACHVSHTPLWDIALTADEMILAVNPPSFGETRERFSLSVRLENARGDAPSELLDPMPGKVNYIKGMDRARWRTNVPVFGKVQFIGIYPGVDIVYYGQRGRLEYDFIVHPNGDPRGIAISFDGGEAVIVESSGDLTITCAGYPVRLLAPVAYQIREGFRCNVPARFAVDADSRVSFEVGEYDATLPLVIDPVVEFSSFVGMPSADARGVGVDNEGNMYVCGMTRSPDLLLPGTHFDSTLDGDEDIFVVKFSPDGSQVLYSTYIGGSDKDTGKTMHVDANGYAYIAGNTKSTDMPSAGYISRYAPTYNLLVLKLNPAGDALEYCCVFGGEGMEEFRGITVDSGGNCIAVGGSHSPDLPTTPGSHQPVYNDPPEDTPEVAGSFTKGEDCVIAKINPDGTDFVFLTWLGGHGFEKAWGVVTDSADDIYLTGHVEALDFPVTDGAFQKEHGGGIPRSEDQYGPKDAFVAKLSADGGRVLSATYFGGSGQDTGYGIGVDAEGSVYVAGNTSSTDLPVHNAHQERFGGGASDFFVACFDPELTQLRYGTYLGGQEKDELCSDGLAVDPAGYAYAVGGVASAIPGVAARYNGGESDAFLARLAPRGALDYFGLYGGSGAEQCGAVAIDTRGGVYLSGRTDSADFAIRNPYPTAGNFKRDAFLVKVQFPESTPQH